jgi:hypothetical protein
VDREGEIDDVEKDAGEDEAAVPIDDNENENNIFTDIDEKIKKFEEEDSQPITKAEKAVKKEEGEEMENSPYYKNLKV